MLEVPNERPVTSPSSLIVATVWFVDIQGLAELGVPLPDSCRVDPRQTTEPPVIVGNAFIRTA